MIKNWIVSSSEELDSASSPKPAEEPPKASSQEAANPQVSFLGLDVSLSIGFPRLRAYSATSRAQRLLFQSWMPFLPLTSPPSTSRPRPLSPRSHLTPSHHSHSPTSMQRSASHPSRQPSPSLLFHRVSFITRPLLLLPTSHQRTPLPNVPMCSARS